MMMTDSNPKPEVDIEQLTQQFFDWIVFPLPDPELALEKFLSLFWGEVLVEVDNFSGSEIHSIDRKVFCDEMTAIRLELFSLACDQAFGKETIDLSLERAPNFMPDGRLWRRKKEEPLNEEAAIQLSILMKRYLQQRGRLDTWEAMGEYNFALGQSRYLSYTWKQQQDISSGFDVIRNELLDRWEKSGVDIRCIDRVANRINVDARQWNSIAMKRLAVRLAQRLEAGSRLQVPVVYSPERQIGFTAVIYSLYLGAKEFLKSNETGIDMDKPFLIAGNQLLVLLKSMEEPWDYYCNHENEWLETSTYRADGSGFGILFDYWSSK